MPTSDPLDRRGYDRIVERHAERLLQLAKNIQFTADSLVRDLELGDRVDASRFLQSICRDGAEGKERLEVLDALKEARFVIADEET
ncbi:hypothetical protein [Microbispora sp. NPDC049125]|uniref:hypothetical protein n=1 Tax=Microbispora sp. NPDC049125 TaxID=3154929 RepID=UPI003464F80A